MLHTQQNIVALHLNIVLLSLSLHICCCRFFFQVQCTYSNSCEAKAFVCALAQTYAHINVQIYLIQFLFCFVLWNQTQAHCFTVKYIEMIAKLSRIVEEDGERKKKRYDEMVHMKHKYNKHYNLHIFQSGNMHARRWHYELTNKIAI